MAHTFYRVRPEWRRLDPETRRRGREEFAAVVDEYRSVVFIRPYTLVGMRGDCDLMLWKAGFELELFNRIEGELNSTLLGGYLDRPHSLLSMLRKSMYLPDEAHGDRHGTRIEVKTRRGRYLFVYPFVKKRSWYSLSSEERQRMMNEHFRVGNRYPEFEINTAYSFGLDDQEFVVSFEGDNPRRFVDLVMELRNTEASSFTERDTPIFTCIAADLREALELAA